MKHCIPITESKLINPLEPFLKNVNRREFRSVRFDVTKPYPYDYKDKKDKWVLNLFRGFKARVLSPAEMDDATMMNLIKPILNHIKVVMANNRDGVYEYILNWIACLFRGIKIGTGLFLYGSEGCGKSFLWSWLWEMVICLIYAIKITGADFNHQVVGRFGVSNEEMLVLKIIEELPETERQKAFTQAQKLKALVTEKQRNSERKAKDAKSIEDVSNIVINTNNPTSLYISRKDRRWLVAFCLESHAGNHEYFKNLSLALEDPNVADAFITFMARRDISKFHGERDLPQIEDKKVLADEMNVNALCEEFAEKLLAKNLGDCKESIKMFDKQGRLIEFISMTGLKKSINGNRDGYSQTHNTKTSF